MTAKSRQIFMSLVGAYLVYIGGLLVRDTIAGSPKYENLLIVFGGVFVAFGVITVFMNVKSYIKESKEETVDSSDVIDEEEEEED